MDPAHGVFYLQPGWNGNYQITAGLGIGDKQESEGQKIERWFLRQHQQAAGGNGCLYPPGASPPWGQLLLYLLLLIPLELCTGLNQLPICPTAHRSQHLVF